MHRRLGCCFNKRTESLTFSVLDSTEVAVGKQGWTDMPTVLHGGDYRQALLLRAGGTRVIGLAASVLDKRAPPRPSDVTGSA